MSNTFTKPSDLIAGTTARAEDINNRVDATETGFDNVEVITNRTIKLPVGTAGDQLISESAANRALKEVGFDASGNLVLISAAFQWKGDWATSTAYIKNDVVRDSGTKNIYTVQSDHTSGVLATDISGTKLSLAISVAEVEAAKVAAELAETNAETARDLSQDWAEKTSGAVTGTSYSSKHWATTGTVATVSAAIANVNTTATNIANVNKVAVIDANVTKVAVIDDDVTTVAGIDGNVTTVAGISANVTTAAGVSANITTAAGIASNITTVAGISSDVTAVAGKAAQVALLGTTDAIADMNTLGTADVVSDLNTLGTADAVTDMNTLAAISANITTAAGVAANVTTVAGLAADVTTTAGIAANVTAVAGKAAQVTLLGTSDAVSDMNTLGTADAVADMNTLAAIAANVTTAAGIAANITTTAGIAANVTTVAGNTANINTNATNIAAIQGADANATTATTQAGISTTKAGESSASALAASNSAASAAASLDNFDDRYLGAKSSAPTVDNDGNALVEGAMYFDSSANGMKVYDGADWIAASAAGTASMLTYKYTATSGQTTFTGADANSLSLTYTVANIIVMLNGITLDAADFTATSGTSVVLGTGATTGDELVVVAFKSFTVADHYTQAQADALLAAKAPLASPTFTGNFTSTGIDDNATSETLQIENHVLKMRNSSGGQFQAAKATNFGYSASYKVLQLVTGASSESVSLNYDPSANASGAFQGNGSEVLIQNGSSFMSPNAANNGYHSYLNMLNGNVTVNTGNLVIGTSGRGIDFSANANAGGMTSEVLDDYEEGTWQPATSLGTIDAANAKYTKVGNKVTVWFVASSFSERSSSNYVSITGLPFVSNGHMGHGTVGSVMYQSISTATPNIYLNGGASYLNFYGNTSGGWSIMSYSHLSNSSSSIYGHAIYYTDS